MAEETSCLCKGPSHEILKGFRGRSATILGGWDTSASPVTLQAPGQCCSGNLTRSDGPGRVHASPSRPACHSRPSGGWPWSLSRLHLPPPLGASLLTVSPHLLVSHCRVFALGHPPAWNTLSEKMGAWRAGRAAGARPRAGKRRSLNVPGSPSASFIYPSSFLCPGCPPSLPKRVLYTL